MSDQALRAGLIRLAHSHPEFRKDLLPLIKEAGCEKLPEGGMRDNCEKKKEEGAKAEDKKEAAAKVAGMMMLRKMVQIKIRTQQAKREGANINLMGIISIALSGGASEAAPFRFEASFLESGGVYSLVVFRPLRNVTGAGSDALLKFYEEALKEAALDPTRLFGPSVMGGGVPEPVLG